MCCEEIPSDNSARRNRLPWAEMDYEREAEGIGVSKLQKVGDGSNECWSWRYLVQVEFEEMLVFMWRNLASLCSLCWVLNVISVFTFVEEDIQNTIIMESSRPNVYVDIALATCFVNMYCEIPWTGVCGWISEEMAGVIWGCQPQRGRTHIQSDAQP
jgi:hypothetical protein